MDIQYLLFLQNLREVTGGIFNDFFNSISKFSVEILPYIPFIIFWGVDKKWGYRFFATFGIGDFLNGLIKLTVCAYRPWIRSPLIEPAGDSKTAATGYSFPSGHTMKGTAMYGSIFVWQKEKRRWLAIFCGILIALTGFSRNYLGVHTPQDVLVGFLESVLIITAVGFAQKKINGDNKKLDILSLIGIFAIAAALIYITHKKYPMDYVDGKLLVNPQKMMNDCFQACGMLLGLIAGSFIERHFIHYKIPAGSKNLPLLTGAGLLLVIAWKNIFGKAFIVSLLGKHWGNLLSYFILSFFAIAIWPIFITKWADSEAEASN